MIRYANASIHAQRRDDKEDRAGVIVFGKNAEVEVPPVDFSIQLAPKIESLLDPDYTNLAGAMQRAMSLFPHDTAKRVVLVTDGNENIGNALEQARTMADAGVSIDVMPVPLVHRTDIAVEKVALPADVRRGQPFELRVVLNNTAPADARPSRWPAIYESFARRASGRRRSPISRSSWSRGSGCFRCAKRSTCPISTRTRPASCRMIQMRTRSRRTTRRPRSRTCKAKGQVLLIEDWENPGEFDYLVERLRKGGAGDRGRAEQSAVHVAAGAAAVRHDHPGQRAAHQRRRRERREQLFGRSDQDAGAQHGGAGLRAGDARRAEQLWGGRLDEHRAGKGDAGRFPDQEREGGAGRRAGAQHARQRNPAGQLLAESDCRGGAQGTRAAGLLRADIVERHKPMAVGAVARRDAPRRAESADDAVEDRQDEHRRHARLRAGDEAGGGRAGRAHGRGDQAHDRDQRRRPLAADGRDDGGVEGGASEGDDRGGRLARHPGQPGDAGHRHADRRQVLRGEQRQRAAEDLSARGPADRSAAGVRAEAAGRAADQDAA